MSKGAPALIGDAAAEAIAKAIAEALQAHRAGTPAAPGREAEAKQSLSVEAPEHAAGPAGSNAPAPLQPGERVFARTRLARRLRLQIQRRRLAE